MRAQAARLLHRRHLFVAGRLALRHVVLVVDIEGGFLRNHARCRETRRSTIGMEVEVMAVVQGRGPKGEAWLSSWVHLELGGEG